MDIEKYTDRAKGFLQSAQTMALRRGHQRLTPEHLLKVLLEDTEGLCANLIRAAGGDPKAALQAVDAELDRLPKVEGSGAGKSTCRRNWRGSSNRPSNWRSAPATAL
jgi:ATP-dependent Clp protease ATP-binding subunit ClpB